MESLMTAPVRDGQVVLAKYFAALFFYGVLWAPSLLYFVVFSWITRLEAAGRSRSTPQRRSLGDGPDRRTTHQQPLGPPWRTLAVGCVVLDHGTSPAR